MTQDELKKKSVCVKCKWCQQETVGHKFWTEYKFKCTNCVLSLDPVTGDETYMDCVLKNSDGNCEMFEEPKKSWFERFTEMIFRNKSEN